MSVAFAPSGNLVASGGLDNICTVYNIKAASPKTLRELDAHTGEEGALKLPLNAFNLLHSIKTNECTHSQAETLTKLSLAQVTCLAAVSLAILRS